MKGELHTAKSFRSDYKKLSKSESDATDFVIKQLLEGKILDSKYRDHDLQGNYKGYRECHVFPDLLLVYKRLITGELLILTVYRIDSHTNIFDINKSQKKK
ncbi:MAG: type II toxin-antitoxin system YafQ family toxin [Treponema sp.]|nr:type II toxin-antitoxin system YafQ family toxin [Treponema sp.]